MNQCPFANLLDPENYVNGLPLQEMKRISDDGAIHWVDDDVYGVPYWLVTGRDEIDFVSKHPALFSSAAKCVFLEEREEDFLAAARNMFINMDPPEHQRYRRIVKSVFTPSKVDCFAPRFREHARRIIDAVAPRGECEFVEEVAAELPLLAILELCGIPPEDRKDFFHWTNATTIPGSRGPAVKRPPTRPPCRSCSTPCSW